MVTIQRIDNDTQAITDLTAEEAVRMVLTEAVDESGRPCWSVFALRDAIKDKRKVTTPKAVYRPTDW
jgi:hypothetical protein